MLAGADAATAHRVPGHLCQRPEKSCAERCQRCGAVSLFLNILTLISNKNQYLNRLNAITLYYKYSFHCLNLLIKIQQCSYNLKTFQHNRQFQTIFLRK